MVGPFEIPFLLIYQLVVTLEKWNLPNVPSLEIVNKYALKPDKKNKIDDFFGESQIVKTLALRTERPTDEGRNTILKSVKEKSVAKFKKFFKDRKSTE